MRLSIERSLPATDVQAPRCDACGGLLRVSCFSRVLELYCPSRGCLFGGVLVAPLDPPDTLRAD